MAGTAIMVMAFLSGLVGLVSEVIWSRYLHLITGLSAHAVAIVLACFMLGLALGSWRVGRWLDRGGDALRILSWLQAGLALCLALSPWIYARLSECMILLCGTCDAQGWFRHGLVFLLALSALLVPTGLMGGTLPALVAASARRPGCRDGAVGVIYALETLGGAVGAVLAGFVLIRLFGLGHTLHLAAGISLAMAVIAAVLSRRSASTGTEPPPRPEPSVQSPRTIGPTLAVLAISGFTALAYQVFWTRILTAFFRDSIYDLTLVLAIFLTGIVTGSLVGGRFIRARTDAVLWLGLVEVCIGVCALAGLFLVDRFPYLINDLQTNTALVERYGGDYWTAAILIRCACAALLMSVPTCLFGATFPIAARIITPDGGRPGSPLGTWNALNLLGAMCGSLAAGFVLIPWLGVQGGLVMTAFVNIAAGLGLVVAFPAIRSWRATAGAGAAVAVLLAVALPGWDRLRMSLSFLDQRQPLEDLLSLRYYREDAGGITSVVEVLPLQRRYLVTNRLYAQNNSSMMGLEDHRRLGHIPMLLHPDPRQILVIGLGAGITLRAVADHGAEAIDCVEWSPGVVEASRHFAAENHRVWEDPRVHIVIDDGRSHVATTSRMYDVIILDIIFPMSAGSGAMFSREYAARCRSRLRPGGLVCQWLPIHQMAPAEITTVIATFQSVFPHASLWHGLIGGSTAVVGLIGTAERWMVDAGTLAQRCRRPELAQELQEVNLGDPHLLLSHHILGEAALAEHCRGWPLDTDDRPVVEFLTPRLAMPSSRQGRLNLLAYARLADPASLPVDAGTAFSRSELERCVAGKRAVIEGFGAGCDGDQEAQRAWHRAALARDPGNVDLLDQFRDEAQR